jgi:CHAD domain-containing protein
MEPSPPIAIPANQLLKRAEKRLGRFAARFEEIFDHDNPEAIHDTRVQSRRLQQLFNVIFPKPRSGKQRKLIRFLRKVRRQLGQCRTLDVNLDLIAEMPAEAPDAFTRQAWEQFGSYLRVKRKKTIGRARKKLSRHKTTDFVALSRRCFDRAQAALTSRDNYAWLKGSLRQAECRWAKSLALANEDRTPEHLHGVRIAAKRLRYRAELLADFGDPSAKSLVRSLKDLQQKLGSWHDRHLLFRSVAEFVARPDFLLDHPAIARSLLNEMERERNGESEVVDEIMKSADKISNALESRARSSSAGGIMLSEVWSHPRFAQPRP